MAEIICTKCQQLIDGSDASNRTAPWAVCVALALGGAVIGTSMGLAAFGTGVLV